MTKRFTRGVPRATMSSSARHSLTATVVAGLLLFAGCLGGVVGPSNDTGSTPTTTANSPSACVDDVSFWGLQGPTSERLWSPDRVRIGYTLPPNASVFFVAYEDDTVLGVTHARNGDPDYAIASDGDEIHLETALEGTHTIRVVAIADVNRNGEFDPGTDVPCHSNGALAQAGPETIDFDRFDGNQTTDKNETTAGPTATANGVTTAVTIR